MDRRAAGLVLLILVVLAAVAVPHAAGRRIPGSPVGLAVTGPPRVGDCVGSLSPEPAADQQASAEQPLTFPFAGYTPCAGPVLGEVMSVDSEPVPADQTGESAGSAETAESYQNAMTACALREVGYVGSIGPFDPDQLTRPSIAWYPAASVDALVIGPDPIQRAVGQRWTACAGVTVARTPYRGVIAKALTVGVLPSAFATCRTGLPSAINGQAEDQVVDCSSPHPVELLGTTQIVQPDTSVRQVQRSCTGFAARAMRTSDPTRGGVLRVRAYSLDGPPILPNGLVDITAGYLGCLVSVAAPGRLTGTLLGLGDRPAPISH